MKQVIKSGLFEIWYHEFKDYIYLDKIEVAEEYRGQGHGTQILKNFIQLKNKRITIIVEHYLILFYERIGFTKMKDVGSHIWMEYKI